jgi:membrane-bound serine protease (ClpP class)
MKLFTATAMVTLALLALQSYSQTVLVEVEDIVDGGTVSLVRRAAEKVPPGGLLVLYIDSYGGYLASADSIAELIVSRGFECAVYVPPGGKAVSAAALISIACGRIYMAPSSVIGAARPYPDDPKTVNYVASRFRSLASRVFKNETTVDTVVRFVTDALSLTDREAEELGIARRVSSLDEVLEDLKAPRPAEVLSKDIWDRILSAISDPLVYSIALAIGVFLIVAEVLVTGFQGYVVAGVLLLATALYGMSLIPPDILVLTLMTSGAVLVLVELLNPGIQGFGIAGTLLLALGTYMTLRGRPVPVGEPVVLGLVTALGMLGAFLGFVIYKAAQTAKIKKPKLRDILLGAEGIAKTDIKPSTPGVVHVLGEDWSAYSLSGEIPAGSKVLVKEVRGLFLYVEKKVE